MIGRAARWAIHTVSRHPTTVAVLGAAAWYWFALRSGGVLWRLPGMPVDRLNAPSLPRLPPNAGSLVARDSVWVLFVAAVPATMVVTAWPSRPERLTRWLHLSAAAMATLGYLVCDLAENAVLRDDVLPRLPAREVTAAAALSLERAMVAKWSFLVLAALLAATLHQRRPPVTVPPRSFWSRDPARVPKDATWKPVPGRLGIALSGGGVRSASYCLGVLQELRARELLAKARYVTAVSGGGYIAGAYTALNHDPPPDGAVAGYAPGSPELQRLRRSLRYIATDTGVLLGALARIVFGVFLNLWLLYLLLFAFARPLGWVIGTPLGHRELRIERLAAVESIAWSAEPGLADPDQAYRARCAVDVDRPDNTTIASVGAGFTITADPPRRAWAVTVAVPRQCFAVILPPDTERAYAVATIDTTQPGIVSVVDGKLSIDRQPTVGLASASIATLPGAAPRVDAEELDQQLHDDLTDLMSVTQPKLAVTTNASGLDDAADVTPFVKVDRPLSLQPRSILDRRHTFDIDPRHWLVPLIVLAIAIVMFAVRVIWRPHWWRGLDATSTLLAVIATAVLVVQVVVPALVDWLPRSITRWLSSAPPASFGGGKVLPIPLPPLLAWPILSISAFRRFTTARKQSTKPQTESSPANRKAFLAKVLDIARKLLVTVLLLITAAVSTLTITTVGALNGPGGNLKWVSTELVRNGLTGTFPNDVTRWLTVVVALLVLRGCGEAAAWSLGPIYKRRLMWAYGWRRTKPPEPDGACRQRYGPDFPKWEELSGGARNGFLDGAAGDGTELVLCCTANVLGEDRAPTGRRAVSFTMSRSFIGGPEIGWVPTPTYVNQLGPRRHWDVTLPGGVALSGAAASPAMGKTALGPYGSVLAVLNVRLGAWVPHPAYVAELAKTPNTPPHSWTHNPGWPWFVREVFRRHKPDAPYLYVTDGGHWENLGLVEALRRGCTTIIVVSAAGDGELSNATLAEAVEIARSDLGVEIRLDDAWTTRPPVGGDPAATLPSGRQYVLNPGPTATLGRVAKDGWAFGTFTYPDGSEGELLLLDASMIDRLPVDVHAYAEAHPEFPNVSTGDQLFSNRDFESYRILGRELTTAALETDAGRRFSRRADRCDRRQ